MQILFDTTDFPSRWHCGQWTSLHGWTHITADIATGVAYFMIPTALIYFLRRRRDIEVPRAFWLFPAFILSCGAVHIVEASIFWFPWYRFSALLKVITAVVSAATALALIRLMPFALNIPGMAAMNEKLKDEVEQREQTERVLRTKNLQLDHFASVASHDLKAPLRAITNLASWIEADCEGKLPAESEEHLKLMMERVSMMEDLVENLLDFSRAGEDVHLVPLDVEQEARETVQMLDVPAEASVEIGSFPPLNAPKAALRLILRNLIGNALDHGQRPDIKVTLTGRVEADHFVLEVADDGVGVPEDLQDSIFEPFTTTGNKYGKPSHGLGLAAVRRTASTIGGRIHLKKNEEGAAGATFVVTIPMRAPTDQTVT